MKLFIGSGPIPTRSGSHPLFSEAAPDDFFDPSVRGGPFANGPGLEALQKLEEWYDAGGSDGQIFDVLSELPTVGVIDPDVWQRDPTLLKEQIEVGLVDRNAFQAEAQARTAVGVGQFKIRGGMTAEALSLAKSGVGGQLVVAMVDAADPGTGQSLDPAMIATLGAVNRVVQAARRIEL
ncbi:MULTISPECIES: hypothetical protein [unclassified Brevibacterium]|uniref:hypothetical protein n=1 Tax=unclassified Brevibacterium TaxID=2614124 RepID=UPI0008A318FF|nr:MULTISPECIES: hypothetical protein [unclassified Brevibacterium]OFL68638.1 hypothetical protein HMPREF2757_08410 [Brevibacterium sp. HMSC063G07]OFS25792.1 hypothetical protein HMPREF3162_07550 [Brevibacterium sp. HMSC07C04]